MMIIEEIENMREHLDICRQGGESIGLVPTMGFFHEGHLSLIRQACRDNDTVVVSVFVNPAQFGPDEDYEEYPRDLERDVVKARELGVDFIFSPETSAMYPEGYRTFVEVEELSGKLCGVSRPNFFRGVATVVSKLFNIIEPDRAYFGQKDFQQFLIIDHMVKDLNIPLELKMLPIVREEDGLAVSSRNDYLKSEEQEAAIVLFRALTRGKNLIENGFRDSEKIKNEMEQIINKEELAAIDYVKVVDPETLNQIKEIEDSVLLALAVYIGETRLIDNFYIDLSET